MQRWRPAYVALGSNLDDPPARVRAALGRLGQLPDTRLVAASSSWVSRPLGPLDQPDYVNAVAGLLTRLTPPELLRELKSVESAMGRPRPVQRWGPRVIDLDLVAYGAESVAEPGLTVPHPGVQERDFVLYPLAEIAPELWIPGSGRVRTLAARVEDRGLARLAE
jgi:2-amino-4-hydroxy-6-hydroxymethyldihydropteridine diphosphokinase